MNYRKASKYVVLILVIAVIACIVHDRVIFYSATEINEFICLCDEYTWQIIEVSKPSDGESGYAIGCALDFLENVSDSRIPEYIKFRCNGYEFTAYFDSANFHDPTVSPWYKGCESYFKQEVYSGNYSIRWIAAAAAIPDGIDIAELDGSLVSDIRVSFYDELCYVDTIKKCELSLDGYNSKISVLFDETMNDDTIKSLIENGNAFGGLIHSEFVSSDPFPEWHSRRYGELDFDREKITTFIKNYREATEKP